MSFAIIDFNDSKWKWNTKVEYYADRIEIFLPQYKTKRTNRYAKKVIGILNKNRVKDVVLNKNLLNNRIFCENMVNAKKQIITGERMYKAIILRVLKDLSFQMKLDLYKLKVVLLINEYGVENVDLIRIVSKEVKSLTIVTNDKSKFKTLEKELFENDGIILKVTEKSEANLKDSNIVINIDFQSYDMNRIKINNNSLIICGFAKEYEIKKNFDGIIIRKIDVIDPENANSNLDDLSLCEAKIYSYLRKLKQNDRAFEREGFKVNGYYGENGRLTLQDFKKYGQKIV